MTAINAALAFAVASYSKSNVEAPITKVVEQKLVKLPRKAKAPKVETVQVEPAKSAAPIVTFKLPEAGSLGAKGFLKMMRSAKERNEKILAIAAFVGYDQGGDFGSQEMSAMMAARRELSPIDTSGPSMKEERDAKRSALGYVKGMPDGLKVKLQDLLRREELAVETMTNEYRAADAAMTQEEKTLHLGLALLEKERLEKHIKPEIRSIAG